MSRRTGLRLRRRAGELRLSLLGACLPVLLLLLPLPLLLLFLFLLLLLEMVFTSAECISHQLAEISACRVSAASKVPRNFVDRTPMRGTAPRTRGSTADQAGRGYARIEKGHVAHVLAGAAWHRFICPRPARRPVRSLKLCASVRGAHGKCRAVRRAWGQKRQVLDLDEPEADPDEVPRPRRGMLRLATSPFLSVTRSFFS